MTIKVFRQSEIISQIRSLTVHFPCSTTDKDKQVVMKGYVYRCWWNLSKTFTIRQTCNYRSSYQIINLSLSSSTFADKVRVRNDTYTQERASTTEKSNYMFRPERLFLKATEILHVDYFETIFNPFLVALWPDFRCLSTFLRFVEDSMIMKINLFKFLPHHQSLWITPINLRHTP